jgi:hypothetical protein
MPRNKPYPTLCLLKIWNLFELFRRGFIAGATIALCLWSAQALAECYMDTPSGYGGIGGASRIGPYPDRSSCESVNSQYFSGQGSCSCTAAESSDRNTAPGYEQPAPSHDYEAERQRQEQAEAERRAQEERAAAEDRMRREEEARVQFEQDKDDTLKQMKDVQGDTLKLKSGNIGMGVGAPNPTGELNLKPADSGAGATSPEKAFACATWIANYAFPAARKGDVHEVRYLGQQVEQALKGETPGVECPSNLEPVPEIKNAGPIGPGSDLYRFYDKLLNATAVQAEKIDVSRRKLQEMNLDHLTVKDLPKLQQQINEAGKPAPQSSGQDKKAEEQEKKRRALEEARKALEEAKRAAINIDDLERKSSQVGKEPARASTLAKQIQE